MPERRPSRRKIIRLQTLWSLYWTRRVVPAMAGYVPTAEDCRMQRLGWIAGRLGLDTLESTKDLTAEQIDRAIDELQRVLPKELITHRRGRRGRKTKKGSARSASSVVSLPKGATLELIGRFRASLQMDETRFQAWLGSRTSPLRGRHEIRTERDAQAVVNGLRRILRAEERGVRGVSLAVDSGADPSTSLRAGAPHSTPEVHT